MSASLITGGITASLALIALAETDLLPGGSSGFDPKGGDAIIITLREIGNVAAIDTVRVYTSTGVAGGVPIRMSATTSVAIGGPRKIELRGYIGGPIRVTATAGGTPTVYAEVASYVTGQNLSALQVVIDDAPQPTSILVLRSIDAHLAQLTSRLALGDPSS